MPGSPDFPFLKRRVIPAASVASVDEAKALAEAMLAGGLDVIEITFRTPVAADAIAAVGRAFPEMVLGAGTVLSCDQLDAAIQGGITYAVAPGIDASVVAHAQENGVELIPGVITPSEISCALKLGCRFVKFFPAEASGGVKLLKSLSDVFAHTGLRYIPTGGIRIANAADYLSMEAVAAVGGSWMVSPALVKSGDWSQITDLCREVVDLAAGF